MTTTRNPGMRMRVLLMVLLGTIAVAGVIAWPGPEPAEDTVFLDPNRPGEDQTLEVQPILMRGKITAASWRSRATPLEVDVRPQDTERDETGSDIRRERYRASLEETVEPISGLGVYVAPVESRD